MYPNLTLERLAIAQAVLQDLQVVNNERMLDAIEARDDRDRIEAFAKSVRSIEKVLDDIEFEIDIVKDTQDNEQDA